MSNRSLQGWGSEGSRACASHHKGPTARAAPAAATFSMGGPGSRVEMRTTQQHRPAQQPSTQRISSRAVGVVQRVVVQHEVQRPLAVEVGGLRPVAVPASKVGGEVRSTKGREVCDKITGGR